MRASRLRAGLIVMVAAVLFPLSLAAELTTTVTISGYTSLLYSGDPEDPIAAAAVLKSSLNIDSLGNKNVKGYFQLDSWISDSLGIDVPRAYLKVRFPRFRLTLGKTRVSWGDGFAFNAGDVLFGSMSVISADLSGETLRAETGWLGAVYLPLGAFSYLEAVIVPYGLPAAAGSLETSFSFLSETVSLDQLSAGVRGAFKFGSTTLETGYYASGTEAEHRPYLSLHGHLLVDWNLSAAMAVPMFDPQWQRWEEWSAISAGAFHLINLGLNRTLSFRLEAAVRPGGVWREAAGAEAEAIASGSPGSPVYGIYLYPEIAFSPTETLSLQLRALVSPVDLSAFSVVSLSWNVYQGLDVFSYLSFMTGDVNDLYNLDSAGSVSWTTGLEFIY